MGLVPVVVVPGQTNFVVPVELMNHINAAQYQEIVNAIIQAREKGCNYACMAEWGVCLVTCLWCVFLCHSCIENAMVESELQSKVAFLNTGLFKGQRVLSTQNAIVYVNTDLVHVAVQPQIMAVQVQPGVQSGLVQAVDANGQPMYTQDANGQIVPVYIQQPQHHHHHQAQPAMYQQQPPVVAYATAVEPSNVQYATTVSPMAAKDPNAPPPSAY